MILARFTEDGRIRHWSDGGYYIRQVETGHIYEDAVDYLPCIYTYEETQEKIPVEGEDVEIEEEFEEEF